ncbi:MAG: hypothetical protein ABI675_05860 [Chitinophagaceae bacterium]
MSATQMLSKETDRQYISELQTMPSAASSASDFDFLVGHWSILNRKLKARLNGCTEWIEFEACQEMRTVLNGIGNIDNFKTTVDDKPFEGMTLRLFNPATRLWSIYWADGNVGVLDPPVLGSFYNAIGEFYGGDVFNGKKIIVKFKWDKTDPVKPVWSQAFSEDGGNTWEWNWYMYMTKKIK